MGNSNNKAYLKNESLRAAKARKASSGVRDPAVDDAWNTTLMTAVPAPSVVDITTYAVPVSLVDDDKFIRRTSWNKFMGEVNATKDQIQTSMPAPPVVDVNTYVSPPATGTYTYLP